MHALAIVHVAADEVTATTPEGIFAEAKAAAESALEGLDEESNPEGFYDWYQIGGRWAGFFNPDYDPSMDPRNIETCDLCNGTGFRNDALGKQARAETPSYTCNACGTFDMERKVWTHGPHGPGKRNKWFNAEYVGDVIPVSALSDKAACCTLVVNGYGVIKSETYDPRAKCPTDPETGRPDYRAKFPKTEFGKDGSNVKRALEKLGVTDGYLVAVDYHF